MGKTDAEPSIDLQAAYYDRHNLFFFGYSRDSIGIWTYYRISFVKGLIISVRFILGWN